MALGEILALICAFMWASAVVLYKSAGDSLSASALNLIKNSIALCLLIPTTLIVEGFVLPSLGATDWAILVVSGIVGIALADTFFLQALRMLGAGRTAIVASLYSPFVVVLSIFYLGERLATWQWLGFVLVLGGILTVVYQQHYSQVNRSQLIKGVLFAASSVFFTAASVVVMKPILASDGFFWMASLRMVAGLLGMVLYFLILGQIKQTINEISQGSHRWWTIVAGSVFGSYLALLFWLAGFKYTDASVASVLNETANIFIVLMAWLFLKEPLTIRKIAGVVLTFFGVLIFLGLIR